MQDFIPGLKLSELFYTEAAQPILRTRFPQLPYSAALLGWGSEVLGYDDIQSSDHHWGSVNQFVDSTDQLSDKSLVEMLIAVYR